MENIMKKIVIILILFSSLLFAETIFENTSDGALLKFSNLEENEKSLTKIVALPSKNVEIVVNYCEVSTFSKDGKFVENKVVRGNEYAKLTDSFVMRELYGHQIELNLSEENRDGKIVVNRLDLEIIGKDKIEIPTIISFAFQPIYRSIVDNYETSYLNGIELSTPKMLIITHEPLLTSTQYFTEWKNAMGIETEVVVKSELGSTNSEVKEYIQTQYETAEFPPDYVLLVGDVDDAFEIPAFYIFSGDEYDVTDHPYTLLEGEDYFPEMLIGRMSIDSVSDFMTIIAKVLYYEKQPFAEENWFENGTLVAGNYSPSPPMPSTPVKVTKWLRDKMYDYDYNNIDEIYYPPTYPGSAEITSSINNGAGVVSYRGWGDANGWHYPRYHIENLESLNNGMMLPIIASFVCNTGDFANSVDPCFGEAWIRMGSDSNPKGGVIFVGPSDLHTSTKFNNSIFSGFFSGILDENIFSFGAAMLRGKFELYNNFPNNQEDGEDVEFYFHVYNILGDPSLQVRTKFPQNIVCNLPNEINLGTNYLNLQFSNLDGAVVTAIKSDEIFEVAIVENGSAMLFFNSEAEGEITITITKPNYFPLIQTINVVTAQSDIGLISVDYDGENVASETTDLSLTLKNFGTQTENDISAILTTNNEFVTIGNDNAEFGDIAPNATVVGDYTIFIEPYCPNGEILEFTLEISNGNDAKFELFTYSLVYEIIEILVQDENGILEPGEECEIQVTLNNIGEVAPYMLTAELFAFTDAVTVTNNWSSVDDDVATFTVSVANDCAIGRMAHFTIQLVDNFDLATSVNFALEIGEVTNSAPTGPDTFGYYAYDSYDVNYDECPLYEWIEIDPNDGGNGTVLELGDDRSETIALPMNFKFYDQNPDSLTICTNGWISFQPTWETYFRNWNIPSALGPYGMVAAFWDDLIGFPDGDDYEDMHICYDYIESENIFVIEWNLCKNRYDVVTDEKFEIILFDPEFYPTESGNGEIQINYQSIGNVDVSSNFATVGIENFNQSDGLLYTYANIYPNSATALENEFAIKFTTTPPDCYVSSGDNNLAIEHFSLSNYPNPFNDSTTISFNLNDNVKNAELEIYNLKGQLVKSFTVTNDQTYVDWNASNQASGIYFYKMKANGKTVDTRKMVLIK